MLKTNISNLVIKKNGKNNYSCSVNVSILENEKEILAKSILVPFYQYCSDVIENYVKERIDAEIQQIKDNISDEATMKTKIEKVINTI